VRRSLRRSEEREERREKSLKKFKEESEKTWPKREDPDSAEKMTISVSGL
jgi:hypothetical protein